MTKEEQYSFQLGRSASTVNIPCDPRYDRNMSRLAGDGRTECSIQNISAWYMGYLHQYVLDGKPLSAGVFQGAMAGMLPSAKNGAVQPWIEFVADITRNGQFVNFQEESNLETAKAHWYDTLLAGFYSLKAGHGEPAAAKILELGLENLCLYPYELEEAAVQLSQGASLDKLGELMRDGLLESEKAEFPSLQDVLGADTPTQNPQMNMNF